MIYVIFFLALTGALEMLISVRLSVGLCGRKLSRAQFLHPSDSLKITRALQSILIKSQSASSSKDQRASSSQRGRDHLRVSSEKSKPIRAHGSRTNFTNFKARFWTRDILTWVTCLLRVASDRP